MSYCVLLFIDRLRTVPLPSRTRPASLNPRITRFRLPSVKMRKAFHAPKGPGSLTEWRFLREFRPGACFTASQAKVERFCRSYHARGLENTCQTFPLVTVVRSTALRLQGACQASDNGGMTLTPFQIGQLDAIQEDVLRCYEALERVGKAVANFDGWLERVEKMDGVTREQLTRTHGQLIALGYLKFEISSQSAGLRYQLSTAGKQALVRAAAKRDSEIQQTEPDPSEPEFSSVGPGINEAEAA